MNRLQAGLMLVLLPGLAWSAGDSEAEWFNDDWESRVAEVSEGQLLWQQGPITAQTPRVTIHIEFDPAGAQSGWLAVSQCHAPLDPVPAAELVFTERKVRVVRVVAYERIAQVSVQGEQVELTGIGAAARLCVDSEQQIAQPLPGGLLAVIAGPYQRRFLDGYYPQGIEIGLHYPADRFRFVRLHPAELASQADLQDRPGELHFTAHVAGRLKFAFVFQAIAP